MKMFLSIIAIVISSSAFCQEKLQSGSSWKQGDTVNVAISVPATMEKNSASRSKKIADLQKKFADLQAQYNEIMKQNKDDFSILMEIAKVDSSKVYRSKEGAPLISIKSGLLIFKVKP